MSHAHPSPSTMDRKKNVRQFFDKLGLLLKRELQISIALLCRSERCEDPPAHAEVGIAHVRTFFCALKTQGNAAEIVNSHRTFLHQGTPQFVTR